VIVLDEVADISEGTKVTVEAVAVRGEDEDIHPMLKKLIGIVPQDADVKEAYARHVLEKVK